MDDAVEGESGWRSSDSKTCIWNAIYGDDRYDAIKCIFKGTPLRLTRFSDYAVRVLLYLAAHTDRLCSIAEIAKAYDISQTT
jgi:hypothetical protein